VEGNGRQKGSSSGPGSEQWKRLQAQRLETVWNRIASSAEGLGEEVLFQEGEDADYGAEGSPGINRGRWSACLGDVLSRCDSVCDALLGAVEWAARAFVPQGLLPLVVAPASCLRDIVGRSLRSVRSAVE